MKKTFLLHFLRPIARAMVLAGTLGSLILMVNAGRNQHSVLLVVLFTAWVLSPFIALLVINMLSKDWSIAARAAVYFLMLLVSAGSLLGYSGAWNLPGTKNAFKFIMVPLLSWLLIAVIVFVAWRRGNTPRKSRRR